LTQTNERKGRKKIGGDEKSSIHKFAFNKRTDKKKERREVDGMVNVNLSHMENLFK